MQGDMGQLPAGRGVLAPQERGDDAPPALGLRLGLQSVLLDLVLEILPVQSDALGCLRDVPAAALEDLAEILSLESIPRVAV